MFYVYVIKSGTHGTRYVGSTKNLTVRIRDHNEGRCRYTSGRRPWILLHSETYSTYAEAVRRERFLKSGQGRKWIDEITHFGV